MKWTVWHAFLFCLFLGLAGWLSWRYFVIVPTGAILSSEPPAPSTKPDGSAAPPEQDPVQEMGPFAQEPRFHDVIQVYVDELAKYKQLNFISIPNDNDPDGITDDISAVLPSRLRQFPQSDDVLGKQSPQIIRALAAHVALFIARYAGMSSKEYLERLGPHAVFGIQQGQYGELKFIYQNFLPNMSPPPLNGGQTEYRRCFNELDALTNQYRSGAGHAVAFSTDPLGLTGVLAEVPAETAYGQNALLDGFLTPNQQLYFDGKISQGIFVLTTPWPAAPATYLPPIVVRSEVCVIIRTRDDMYPVHLSSIYDPKLERWWLVTAQRCCSPRLFSSPPPGF